MNFYSGIPASSPLEPTAFSATGNLVPEAVDRLVCRCARPLSGDQPVAAAHLPVKTACCHAV